MSYAVGTSSLATLLSHQRFVRQQEQQIRAELQRLSRAHLLGPPDYRPLPPPPPQKPIERRVNYGGPFTSSRVNGRADGFGAAACGRSSGVDKCLHPSSGERPRPCGVAAAIVERQRELHTQQLDRRHQLQQQSPWRPTLHGGAAGVVVPADELQASPFAFDSIENVENFPVAQRGARYPLGGRSVLFSSSQQRSRQQTRISPRSLPAAGVPSGNKRPGDEWMPARRRRQVLRPHAVEWSSSALAVGDPPQRDRSSGNSQGYQESNPAARTRVGDLHISPERAVPSTLPPSLHPCPAGGDLFMQRKMSSQCLPRGAFSASIHCQNRECCATVEAPSPPFGVWNAEQQQAVYLQEERQRQQRNRRYAYCPSEVAAGKPSAQNDRETWSFHSSLRAPPNKARTAVSQPATPCRKSAAPRRAKQNCSYAGTRAAISDEEEMLWRLGVSASPRELLFFRKQPVPAQRQQSLGRRHAGSCRVRESLQGTADALPVRSRVAAGYGISGGTACPDEPCDPVRVRPPTDVWALPAWMRAYGVSSPPLACPASLGPRGRFMAASPAGAHLGDQLEVPLPKFQDYGASTSCGGQKAAVCRCRCCRLRAYGKPEVNLGDLPCCCCPCCSFKGSKAGDAAAGLAHPDDVNCREVEAVSETLNDSVDSHGKCSRCGNSFVAETPEQRLAPPEADHGLLPLEKAATVCKACSLYLRSTGKEALGGAGGASDDKNFKSGIKPDVRPERHGASRQSAYSRQQGDSSTTEPTSAMREGTRTTSPDSPTAGVRFSATGDQLLSSARGQANATLCVASSRHLLKVPARQRSGGSAVGRRAETGVSRSVLAQLPTWSQGPPASNSVWDSPRVVSKICQFLSLSKLLVIRRCNKTLLQAAQFRMRYVLYKSLYLMLRRPEVLAEEHPDLAEAYHCPLAPRTLIKLLGLQQAEVDAIKEGTLPRSSPPEAATPRMEAVAGVNSKALAEWKAAKEKEAPAEGKPDKELPAGLATAATISEAPPAVKKKPVARYEDLEASDVALKQRLLLDARMASHQAQEEARLKALRMEQQVELPSIFAFDEAASRHALGLPSKGSAVSQEPATFRRVRHAFLKLWNYDDDAFRQALVRAASISYPTWLFDVSALLLRAVFQICCNALSAPSLKDLISLFSPRHAPSAGGGVPFRSDSYLWAKMARISGYTMHLVSDATWPPLKDPVVRLVAQPFVNPKVFIRGSGMDEETLQAAAAGAHGVVPLILRPAVLDSLEVKMSRVPVDFITEFISYGKQQQLLHSLEFQGMRGVRHQVKASQELVLLMDLYEWLASVLTHNRKSDVDTVVRGVPSLRAPAGKSGRSKALTRPAEMKHSLLVPKRAGGSSASNSACHCTATTNTPAFYPGEPFFEKTKNA